MALTKQQRATLYTARWYANRLPPDENSREIVELLGEALGDDSEAAPLPDTEPDRPNLSETGAGLLWYPAAETDFPKARTRGRYAKGYPQGAVVHFTAGWPKDSLGKVLGIQRQTGMCYFVIDHLGNVGQNFPLDRWGYHAGPDARWEGLPGTVSDELVGIEVACPGKLDASGKAWFGGVFDEGTTRLVRPRDNIKGGRYYCFTAEQETALRRLLLWLHSNKPTVFKLKNVVGHDEVAYKRKNDPGGSLRCTMRELREELEEAARHA